jgi:hypothetical protein
MKVDHYQAKTGSSRNSILKMKLTDGKSYRMYTVYSLKLSKLKRGDIIQCHAQLEVAMPHKLIERSINIMVGYTLMIHDKKTILHGYNTNLDDLGEQGEFLYPCHRGTQDMSHNVPIVFTTLVGSTKIKKDGDIWVSVISYSASSRQEKGDIVNVDKSYGGLAAIVNRV